MNGRRWRSEIRRRRRPRLHEERNADSTALTGDGAFGHASARVPSDTGRTAYMYATAYTPRQPLCAALRTAGSAREGASAPGFTEAPFEVCLPGRLRKQLRFIFCIV